MLKANKSSWFEKLFTIYNRNLLKRRFNSLNVFGLENLNNRNKEIPTIIYANHSSWWDGLITFQITQKVDADFYVMMEEKQLQTLQLFRKLGAFSVVRENPRSAVQSMKYACEILKTKHDSTLCIFPQGKILPSFQRPIKFYNGLARIIEKVGECQIFCIAMRYEFFSEYKPEIFVSVDNIQTYKNDSEFDSKELTANLEIKMIQNLDTLNLVISSNNTKDFQNII